LTASAAWGPAVPQLVEDLDGGAVEESRGEDGRCGGEGPVVEREGIASVGGGDFVEGGEPATGEYRASERGAVGEEIDPGDGVVVGVIALGHEGEDRIEIGGAVGVDDEPARLDRGEGEGGV